MMLHITNGDSAVRKIAAAGLSGMMLSWRDVLHDGPVPAGLTLDDLRPLRAGFIAACGWSASEQVLADFGQRDAVLAGFRSHDETVLWFEHDLYELRHANL